MKILRLLLGRKHPESYEPERDVQGWEESKKSLSESLGIRIETTADKINKYYAGLALAKNLDDTSTKKYILLASQWESIGARYKKAGETYPAALSYITAINALKNCRTNEEFTDEKKAAMMDELLLTLKHILT